MKDMDCSSCMVYIIVADGLVTQGTNPDSKVHGANMGPIWGRQDPGGPHVGPMNFAIYDDTSIMTMVLILFSAMFWFQQQMG